MMTRDTAPGRVRARATRASLLSATILATCLMQPAEAARFGITVTQVQDPLLANLAIPDSAPTTGMWSGVQNWPLNAIALTVLPNGKVVSYGAPPDNPGVQNGRFFDVWDPFQGFAGGSHAMLQGVPFVNSFCSAQAIQADGSLLAAGGIFDGGTDKGSAVVNPSATGVSALSAQLANDRYYATMLTLPDGRKLIMGGSYPYLGGWADPQGSINNSYMTGMTPEVFNGSTWTSLFGAKSRDAFGPDNNRFWYPRAWVAPNGKVFGISAEKMWFLDPAGNGSVAVMGFKEPQRQASSATDAPNVGASSTAAMYDTGKIIQLGGNSYDNGNGFLASSRATLVDINGGSPVLTETSPTRFGRSWANATVLPTGVVAVNGGSLWDDQAGNNAVMPTELWDPKSGSWTVGASAAIYRGYHSTAALMQNGTVLTSGGGAPGPVNNQNTEVFYPPYLFTTVNGKAVLAPRGQIISLSTNRIDYGQQLQFELASQNGLSQVVLIGLSIGTHSFNVGQRRHVTAHTQLDQQTVSVTAPASANIAPPGYYQLVAIDRNGVPSPGVIIGLGGVSPPGRTATPVINTQVAAGGIGTGTGTGTSAGTGTGTTGGTTGTGGTGTAGGSGSAGRTTLVASHSGMCLSVPAGNGGDGVPVTQQPCTGAAEQSWTARDSNGGTAFVNGASGKCLDMSLAGAVGNGTQVYAWTCHGGTNQAWTARPQGKGNAYVSVASNLCLDIPGGSTAAGTRTIVWGCHGGANQTFTTGTVSGGTTAGGGTNSAGTTTVGTTGSTGATPPTGAVRLESASNPGTFVRRMYGDLMAAAPVTTDVDRLESSFKVVTGLSGQGVSLQSTREAARYIRHYNFALYLSPAATFAPPDGSFTRRASLAQPCGCNSGPCVSYESTNFPGQYIRVRNDGTLGIDALANTTTYRQQASFCERP